MEWKLTNISTPHTNHPTALPGEEGHIVTGGRDRAVRVWAWWVDEWGRLGVRPQHTLLTERCEVRCLAAGGGVGLVAGGTDRGALYCWSSLTSVLEYVAVGGEQAVTCVTALAEEEGEGTGGEEAASLVATADAGGVVRLYRPTYLDPAKAPLPGEEGEGLADEEEEDSAWQPVAEARLDAPAVGAMVVGAHLVVVSRSGLVMPWPLATLPRFPGEERRAPPPPQPPRPAQAPSATEGGYEEEEKEVWPRRGPPPAPTAAHTADESATAAAEAYLSGLRGAMMEQGGQGHPFVACELGAPAVNSTAAVRAALEAARLAEFDAAAAEQDAAGTASVLAEAARAVNVDPRYRAYRGLRSVEDVRLPPPKVVRRQVDPAWLAKQALRPTARDFFTPGLEGLVVGAGPVNAGTVPLWPRVGGQAQGRRRGGRVAEGLGEGENAQQGRAVDPYLAMYGDAV